MFYVETTPHDDELIFTLRRETDYEKIIGGAKGRFINNVRAAGLNGDIIAQFDAAQTEAELYRAMGASVMMNPIRLMDPLKIMSRFGALGNPIKGRDEFAGAGDIIAIVGNGLALYAGSVGVEFASGDFVFGLYGLAGQFLNDGIEEFSGTLYGGSARAAFNGKYLYMDLSGGVAFVDFETGPVYDGTAFGTQSPKGTAYYGAAEFGVRAFSVGDLKTGELYVMPIARARAFSGQVLNDSESEFAIGGGARIGYRTKDQSIETEYSAYGLMESEASIIGVRMDVNLPRDGAAVSFDIAAMNMNVGWFYKIGTGLRVMF
jgi:hypothetical protein